MILDRIMYNMGYARSPLKNTLSLLTRQNWTLLLVGYTYFRHIHDYGDRTFLMNFLLSQSIARRS